MIRSKRFIRTIDITTLGLLGAIVVLAPAVGLIKCSLAEAVAFVDDVGTSAFVAAYAWFWFRLRQLRWKAETDMKAVLKKFRDLDGRYVPGLPRPVDLEREYNDLEIDHEENSGYVENALQLSVIAVFVVKVIRYAMEHWWHVG
ncbi:MAG TPA: hypothetical protein VEY71_08360 [Chitinophagales bacterium]|nr:hypothetical protein [Chitinophagales bacterium]